MRLLRGLSPRPLAPEARIMPLDQAASWHPTDWQHNDGGARLTCLYQRSRFFTKRREGQLGGGRAFMVAREPAEGERAGDLGAVLLSSAVGCASSLCRLLRHPQGLLRELSPGRLAPEARIMPLDQAASWHSSDWQH